MDNTIPNEMPHEFRNLLAKATIYLKIGPEAYREQDFFNMPAAHWHGNTLETIRHGMEQIRALKGFSMDTPFQGLGISEFYDMMTTLHLEVELQATVCDEVSDTLLDEMHMKHRVTGRKIVLYNRIT